MIDFNGMKEDKREMEGDWISYYFIIETKWDREQDREFSILFDFSGIESS